MSRDPIAVRAYGAFIRLYPRRFRDEYGTDMVAMFREQSRDESTRRVLIRSALDLAITIPTQHLEASMRKSPSPLVPLIYMAIAIAGLLLAVVAGTNPAIAIIGLGIALVAGTVGTVAWRRAAPVRGTPVTGHWWKFVVAGPCLIVTVIILAGMGVEAWELGILTVFAALVSIAIGIMLGVSHLLNHRGGGITA